MVRTPENPRRWASPDGAAWKLVSERPTRNQLRRIVYMNRLDALPVFIALGCPVWAVIDFLDRDTLHVVLGVLALVACPALLLLFKALVLRLPDEPMSAGLRPGRKSGA